MQTQGNPATDNCCSKCWREAQKKKSCEESNNAAASPAAPTPMEVDAPAPPQPTHSETAYSPAAPVVETAPNPAQKVVKKKKKKTSYKSMMANMTKRTKDEADIQKEKEELRKVTGGGVFAKIDKI